MSYPPKNLVNNTYGMLVAIKPTPKRDKGSIVWECLCTCGKQRYVSSSKLLRGEVTSCGEKPCDKHFTTLSKYQRVINRFYSSYRLPASYRNLAFALTVDEFISCIRKPCYYCGETNNIIKVNDGKSINVQLRANGIDRKDNSIGYTLDNIVPCCSICNYAKRILTADEYITHCKKVANFYNHS